MTVIQELETLLKRIDQEKQSGKAVFLMSTYLRRRLVQRCCERDQFEKENYAFIASNKQRVLDFRAYSQYPNVVATAEIHLAQLEEVSKCQPA